MGIIKKGFLQKNFWIIGFKNFNRKYRIENITQESYNAIAPYILGRISNDINNFIVITPSAGLSPKLLGKLRLRAKELLDSEKELILTLKEAEELERKGIVDSIVRKIAQN